MCRVADPAGKVVVLVVLATPQGGRHDTGRWVMGSKAMEG